MLNWKQNIVSAHEAARMIESNSRIFLTGNCSTPQMFLRALVDRYTELQNVEVCQLLGLGTGNFITPEMSGHMRMNSLFIAPNVRKAINEGLADFTPILLSEVPYLFIRKRLPLDVAVIHVSPPDEHGFCSYGAEVGVTKSAAESAKMVIAEVNPHMPRTLGDSFINVSQIDYFIDVDYELPILPAEPPSETQDLIANLIAERIPNGATLQMGIGGIPDAVLRRLTGHKNLGVHTELFSDGVMEMIEMGVITNAKKSIHPGKVVAGFVLAQSQALYTYINDNPIFEMHPTEYVNDPFVIAQNDRMTSINSAIEVDITGQVCSDSIGPRFFSGAGGQLDFVRGAARSKDGQTFIALPSTTKNDTISRIVAQLKPGAGVVTTRYDVHNIVTEYGVAELWGATMSERVQKIISISHPDFREDLMAYAREQNYIGKIFAMS